MSRLTAAARRHGAGGLPRALAQRVRAGADGRREHALEWWFDRRRGISTAGVAMPYQPVHPAAFAEFMSHVPVRTTFIDIGSGRGRALILAREHGFRRAIGVELDASHHAAAVENVRGRAGIELVHGDALDFAFPRGDLAVFIYNPFPRATMAAFVDRIPWGAWVIYEAPLDRDLLDARLDLVAERTERISPRRPRFAVYRALS